MSQDAIVAALLDFIAADGADDAQFNAMALELFAYQFKNNAPFEKFARSRGKTPRMVKSWEDIPAVPINAFKTMDLTCTPITDAVATFMTSGTTLGGVRGKSYHPVLDVYDASMRRNFRDRFMGGRERMHMGILFPSPGMMPNSSLAHYLNLAAQDFGIHGSGHLVCERGIEFSRLYADLAEAEETVEPYALLGASLASFWNFLGHLGLPRGSPWRHFGSPLAPLGLRGAIWGTWSSQVELGMTWGRNWTSVSVNIWSVCDACA